MLVCLEIKCRRLCFISRHSKTHSPHHCVFYVQDCNVLSSHPESFPNVWEILLRWHLMGWKAANATQTVTLVMVRKYLQNQD